MTQPERNLSSYGPARDIFTGTARLYSQYRPRYPEELFDLLRETFALDTCSRVLDLGCGPGPLAMELAPYVDRVVAVDPNAEMLAEAERLAAERRIGNVDWLEGESGRLSSLGHRIGTVDLTVMGRAFHWMDREQTLRELFSVTKPGGGVAVIDDNGTADGEELPWRELIWKVIRDWLGEERRAGVNGVYAHPKEQHGAMMRQSPFREYKEVRIPVPRVSTLDELIGGLFSTSHCAPPVLGDLKDGFEADLREKLLALEPSGRFAETALLIVKMAWKR